MEVFTVAPIPDHVLNCPTRTVLPHSLEWLEMNMGSVRRPATILCICISFGLSELACSQADANAQKIQALQRQLDQMKAQIDSVQAQILELSRASTDHPSAAAPTPAPPSTGGQSVVPAEENSAAQAAALGVVPERKVGQATATYQTSSQDQ